MAELAIRPEVSSRAIVDSNPRLRASDPRDVAATINLAKFEAEYSRPTYSVVIVPQVRVSRYTSETELDSEDYFVSLSSSKILERDQFFGEFSYQRENSITTEQTDSGVFNVNIPRTRYSLEASWLHTLTERASVSAFGNALDVSFEEDPRSTFINYSQFGAGSSLSYALSETTTLRATYSFSNFKTPQTSSGTRSHSYRIGFEHQLDDSVNVAFSIGQNVSEIEFKSAQTQIVTLNPLRFITIVTDESERAAGEILDLVVEKEFERASVRFEWDRVFSPSSQGARQQEENVGGFARYQISRFVDAEFNGSFRQRTQEGTANTRRLNDLEVLKFGLRVLYRISPEWRAEAGFRYRHQQRINAGTSAASEMLFIALRFRPQRFDIPY